eukprot:1240669-Ditylum_brightwellii.AAC.1
MKEQKEELDQIGLLLLESREKNWQRRELDWIGSGFFYWQAERRTRSDWAALIKEKRGRGELDQIRLLLSKSREEKENQIGSGFFYERAERRIGLDQVSSIGKQRGELDWIGLLLSKNREENWIGLG